MTSGVTSDSPTQHTFISHAAEDAPQARLLAEWLENEGLKCWIAPRDIPAGQIYASAIQHAIKSCGVFLLLFSENANKSQHVANEIESCAGEDKPILLVRTDSTDPRSNERISLFLGSHHWFDARNGLEGEHLSRIGLDVRSLLAAADGDPVAVPHSMPASRGEAAGATAVRDSTPAPGPQPSDGSVIGIEVGATKIRGCIVDLGDPGAKPAPGTRYEDRFASPGNARSVLDRTREMVGRIIDDHCRYTPPAGIGIAVPGQVDVRVGTLKFGPNFFGARSVPFKTHISTAFPGIPVRIDNEIRCATRCELHLGTGRDFEDFACIYIGKGVGSGTVVGRRVYFGHNYCAGEIGHVKVSNTGQPCACGQTGCLETFVKAQAIVDRAEAKAIDWESRGLDSTLKRDGTLTPEEVEAAIVAGDAAAREVIAEVGRDLGRGIANYLNLFNPAAIVVGGGIMTGFFLHMADEIAASVQTNALAEVANTPIVPSGHSEEGIALGAALLFYPPDEWPF